MTNVTANVPPNASDLAGLVREHLDELATYACHLVGDPDDAMEFVAGAVHHAAKYPPVRLRKDGRAALYRAVTRACRHEQRYPARPRGFRRLFARPHPVLAAEFDPSEASRMNTVKRAMMSIPQERRAAILLRDLAKLSYREMATALECSPEAAGRLVAAARRDFGTIYRAIAI